MGVNESLTGVNRRLTKKRSPRPIDNVKFAMAVARMIRALGKRVGGADMEDLQELLELQDVLDEVTAEAVNKVRENGGYSWATIGRAAGMTKQGAQQKWGAR